MITLNFVLQSCCWCIVRVADPTAVGCLFTEHEISNHKSSVTADCPTQARNIITTTPAHNQQGIQQQSTIPHATPRPGLRTSTGTHTPHTTDLGTQLAQLPNNQPQMNNGSEHESCCEQGPWHGTWKQQHTAQTPSKKQPTQSTLEEQHEQWPWQTRTTDNDNNNNTKPGTR